MKPTPYANGFISFCMHARAVTKSDAWVFGALKECAVWGAATDIQLAMVWEVSFGELHYVPEMSWLRARSKRKYLKHYIAAYRTRELPGHLHSICKPRIDKLAREPLLEDVVRAMDKLSVSAEKRAEINDRMVAGAAAVKKSWYKHNSFIYTAPTVLLFACEPGMAGATARAVLTIAHDMICAIHQRSDCDRILNHEEPAELQFLLALFKAQREELRGWLQRWDLTHAAVSAEWLKLADNTTDERDADSDIRDTFHTSYPEMHRRFCIHVDTMPHSDFMEESTFSVVRALLDPNETDAKFDLIIRFRQNVLAAILEKCRNEGDNARKANAQRTDSDTHPKCHRFAQLVFEQSKERYTLEAMADAPTMRDLQGKPLKEIDRERSTQQLRVKKEEARAFTRPATSLAALQAEASEIKIAYQPTDAAVNAYQMYIDRLSQSFAKVAPVDLLIEIRCYIPWLAAALSEHRTVAAVVPPVVAPRRFIVVSRQRYRFYESGVGLSGVAKPRPSGLAYDARLQRMTLSGSIVTSLDEYQMQLKAEWPKLPAVEGSSCPSKNATAVSMRPLLKFLVTPPTGPSTAPHTQPPEVCLRSGNLLKGNTTKALSVFRQQAGVLNSYLPPTEPAFTFIFTTTWVAPYWGKSQRMSVSTIRDFFIQKARARAARAEEEKGLMALVS